MENISPQNRKKTYPEKKQKNTQNPVFLFLFSKKSHTKTVTRPYDSPKATEDNFRGSQDVTRAAHTPHVRDMGRLMWLGEKFLGKETNEEDKKCQKKWEKRGIFIYNVVFFWFGFMFLKISFLYYFWESKNYGVFVWFRVYRVSF